MQICNPPHPGAIRRSGMYGVWGNPTDPSRWKHQTRPFHAEDEQSVSYYRELSLRMPVRRFPISVPSGSGARHYKSLSFLEQFLGEGIWPDFHIHWHYTVSTSYPLWAGLS